VAKEAARLLYTGAAEEYIQAKEQATTNLGVKASPSNYEVAVELDKLADEIEGGARQTWLAEMRGLALMLMRALEGFSPRLIGSVWRGTAHVGNGTFDKAKVDYVHTVGIVTLYLSGNRSPVNCLHRHPDHGLFGVLGRAGAVEFLVHALDAEEEEHRR
jgi:hypothetical protein